MADVRFEQATKIYPGTSAPAVDRLDLHIEDGEFMVLVGPSGSGKTTALRMLAGLEEVDAGAIYIGERDVTYLQPKKRDVSMVFQNYALYPYLTVAQNMAFPLKVKKVKKADRDARVLEVARMLGLEEYLERKPGQLSGGQRQRVAMGRAIVRMPSVFLMDEPLSNLDAKLRVQMRADIAALQADFGITTVYVTHDQAEAMTLGQRVAALQDGRLQQCGPPQELYDRPANVFVAGFIGSPAMNLCTLPLGANGTVVLGTEKVPLPDGRLEREGGTRRRLPPRVARARRGGARRGGRGRRGRRRRRARVLRRERWGTRRSSSWPAPTRATRLAGESGSRCSRGRQRRMCSTRPPESGSKDHDTGRAGRELSRRDPRAAGRACASARAPGRVPRCRAGLRRACAGGRAARGARFLGRGRRLRRLRLRPSTRLDGHARLDLADRLLRRAARLLALGRRRSLAVGEHAGRGLVCRAGTQARRAHGRRDERAGVRARLGGGGDAAPRRWRRALGRRDEDVLQRARRARAARRRCSRARGRGGRGAEAGVRARRRGDPAARAGRSARSRPPSPTWAACT